MINYKPVTTILKIKCFPGKEAECLQWMQQTAVIVSKFEGFIEKEIYFSVESNNELLNIFTFKNNESLQIWENSDERKRQTKESELFIEFVKEKTHLAGLEFMFPFNKTPKKWKMVAITVCVIFILLNSLVPVLQQVFALLKFPTLLKSFLA